MMRSFTSIAVLAVAVAVGDASQLLAHKMEVRAVLIPAAGGEPAQVNVEAWYEFGDSAEGTATVTGPDGTVVAETKLDPKTGTCTIPLPNPMTGSYKITVDDGIGHREWVLLAVTADNPAIVSVQSFQRNRWLMGVLGLGVIAGATVVARRMTRPASPLSPAPSV